MHHGQHRDVERPRVVDGEEREAGLRAREERQRVRDDERAGPGPLARDGADEVLRAEEEQVPVRHRVHVAVARLDVEVQALGRAGRQVVAPPDAVAVQLRQEVAERRRPVGVARVQREPAPPELLHHAQERELPLHVQEVHLPQQLVPAVELRQEQPLQLVQPDVRRDRLPVVLRERLVAELAPLGVGPDARRPGRGRVDVEPVEGVAVLPEPDGAVNDDLRLLPDARFVFSPAQSPPALGGVRTGCVP